MGAATVARSDFRGATAYDQFLHRLSSATTRALLLDYDGTIAPFSVNRNHAFPYPAVRELLDCIMSTCHTRLVLISGRAAREIPSLLGLAPHPEIWGVWGFERLLPDGRYCAANLSESVRDALTEAGVSLQEKGLSSLIEPKHAAVAVHWRGLSPSQVDEVRATAFSVLMPISLRARLLLAEFDGGLELHPRGCTKADAVRTIVSEVAADAPIAYLGDDISDEDAFRALNERGLTVLVRPDYRLTAAQIWIRPPAELIHFLTDWVRTCGGGM